MRFSGIFGNEDTVKYFGGGRRVSLFTPDLESMKSMKLSGVPGRVCQGLQFGGRLVTCDWPVGHYWTAMYVRCRLHAACIHHFCVGVGVSITVRFLPSRWTAPVRPRWCGWLADPNPTPLHERPVLLVRKGPRVAAVVLLRTRRMC
jgi:hypothetical protein